MMKNAGDTRLCIYGAQMVGVSTYYAIKELYSTCSIISFIVSDMQGNPTSIDGVPVVELKDFRQNDVIIIVATPENYHQTIIIDLQKKGFSNYICLDSAKEAELMRRYYNKIGKFSSLSDWQAGEKYVEPQVYMSKFYKDRKLIGSYVVPKWIQPIQAGATLTDVKVADIRDDEGDNISSKNVNYCELTAMYWLSKHISAPYMGLFHYRRILDISEEDLRRIAEHEIDVVLPYPTIHYPNIDEHHKRYIKDSDWQAVLQALQELAPEYVNIMPEIFDGQYFYNYNILVAKESVFKKYCEWLFMILARVEELSLPKGNERADRYIGYIGENLTTLYFMYHREELKIAHAGRRMLV